VDRDFDDLLRLVGEGHGSSSLGAVAGIRIEPGAEPDVLAVEDLELEAGLDSDASYGP